MDLKSRYDDNSKLLLLFPSFSSATTATFEPLVKRRRLFGAHLCWIKPPNQLYQFMAKSGGKKSKEKESIGKKSKDKKKDKTKNKNRSKDSKSKPSRSKKDGDKLSDITDTKSDSKNAKSDGSLFSVIRIKSNNNKEEKTVKQNNSSPGIEITTTDLTGNEVSPPEETPIAAVPDLTENIAMTNEAPVFSDDPFDYEESMYPREGSDPFVNFPKQVNQPIAATPPPPQTALFDAPLQVETIVPISPTTNVNSNKDAKSPTG